MERGKRRRDGIQAYKNGVWVRGYLFGACGSGSGFAVLGFGLVLAFQISHLKAGFKVSGSK